ncbi:MAG: hypothetical protein V2A58_15440, partial [Planctomycetota bacterium]
MPLPDARPSKALIALLGVVAALTLLNAFLLYHRLVCHPSPKSAKSAQSVDNLLFPSPSLIPHSALRTPHSAFPPDPLAFLDRVPVVPGAPFAEGADFFLWQLAARRRLESVLGVKRLDRPLPFEMSPGILEGSLRSTVLSFPSSAGGSAKAELLSRADAPSPPRDLILLFSDSPSDPLIDRLTPFASVAILLDPSSPSVSSIPHSTFHIPHFLVLDSLRLLRV